MAVSIGEIELSDPNRPNLNKTERGQGIEVSLEQDFQSGSGASNNLVMKKEMEVGGGGGGGVNGFQVQEAEIQTGLRQIGVLRSASEDFTHSEESCENDCIRKTKKDANYDTCLFTPSDIDLLIFILKESCHRATQVWRVNKQ